MSFWKIRSRRKEEDARYMQQARVRSSDPVAQKMTGGRVYSRADIEALEAEKLRYWRRRRRS